MAIIREHNSAIARDAIVLNLGDLAAQGQHLRDLATNQAKGILDKANEQRKQLIDTAAADGYAAGFEKGFAEGLDKGHRRGHEEAMAQATQAAQALLKSWQEALEQFERQREAMLVRAREDVLRIAICFAERIVGRVIDVDSQVATRQLERILPMILRPSRLTIRVHPDDVPELNSMLPDLARRFDNARDASIESDPALGRGSCVVASASGSSIDASIATQIADLALALIPPPSEPVLETGA